MKKILLIEDDIEKREKIKAHVKDQLGGRVVIVECESLRSGLKTIIGNPHFDLIILDMTMPGFDISDSEPAGNDTESFAGWEIMAQMKLRGIKMPVVVVTQYRSFDQGTVGLEDLTNEFKDDYGDFFKGSIYYNVAIDGWKKELSDHLKKMG